MRTLQEKYNGIQQGLFTKEHFLAEARMQQPQLITRFNGYDDAVKILKNRGMIQEAVVDEISADTFKSAVGVAKGRGENQRASKLGSTFLNSFVGKPLMGGEISKIDIQKPSWGDYFDVTLEVQVPTEEDGRSFIKPKYLYYDVNNDDWNMKGKGLEVTRQDARVLSQIAIKINPDSKYRQGTQHFDIVGMNEAKLTKKSLTDYRYKPTNDMDKYPYEQILRGLRVELEGLGVHGTPTSEEYSKALAKVSKNLAKDSIFYTNQVAGVNPKVDLHDKMIDVKKDNAVDKFNGLKKAELKEGIKNIIKKILSENTEELSDFQDYYDEEEDGIYEMQSEKSDADYRNELNDFLDDNGIYGYRDMIDDIMTGPDQEENSASLADFLDDHQIYGYNKGIERIYADYPYDQHWQNQPDEDEADDISHPRGYEDQDEIDYDDENFSDPFIDGDLEEIATDITGFPKWRELGQDEKDHISKFVKDSGDRDQAEYEKRKAERLKAQSARLDAYISGKKDLEEDIFESVSLKDIL